VQNERINNLKEMEFKRKFGKNKESKPAKGLFLIILLVIAVFLWFKAEGILKAMF
jgi:hypothetical protein